MITHTDRANILIEALPYIQRFNKATIVVKYGGHAMVDDALKQDFALAVRQDIPSFFSDLEVFHLLFNESKPNCQEQVACHNGI